MPELSTAQHIAQTIIPGASLGTFGTDTFVNKEPATKSDTVPFVTVYDTGGFNPTLTSDVVIRNPTVTVRVIGMESDAGYVAAQAKLAAISEFMIAAFVQTVGSTRYFGSYQQGDDLFLGYDSDRPVFTANYRLFKQVV